MEQYIIGVDLGGTTAKLGLFNREGDLLHKWEIPTRTANGGEHILPDISESVEKALKDRGISKHDVIGLGLGVPGAVISDSVVRPCVNLDGWGGNVAERLSAISGLRVKVVNDANAAALGEMWHGGGKGHKDVVFVTLGTGVGGGIIVNGQLLRGVHGAAGEIGHLKLDPSEPDQCGCGKHGCVEQYASATGVVRLAKKRLAADNTASELRKLEKVTAKDVFDCAKAGDGLAMEVVDQFGEYLGHALADISTVCDPEIFVIGGGVSAAGQIILDKVRAGFLRHCFSAAEETKFGLAKLHNDAGIYGCAKLVLG